jgi:hypothetical protein
MEIIQLALEDYKMKFEHLIKHYERLLTRFNYFVGIESALFAAIGFCIEQNIQFASLFFIIIGLSLSVFWVKMSFEDRKWVLLYRKHVRQAANQLNKLAASTITDQRISDIFNEYKNNHIPVADVDYEVGSDFLTRINAQNLSKDRWFTITQLPYWMAGGFIVLWVVALIILAWWKPDLLIRMTP